MLIEPRGCGHVRGHLIPDPHAPEAFTHPATWCQTCKVWVRHPAYPPPEAPPPDADASAA